MFPLHFFHLDQEQGQPYKIIQDPDETHGKPDAKFPPAVDIPVDYDIIGLVQSKGYQNDKESSVVAYHQ